MADFGEVSISVEYNAEEVICGVDDNCVLFPRNNNDHNTTGATSFTEKWDYPIPEQDMLNIQVTEEVICEPWDTNEIVNNVVSEEVIGDTELITTKHEAIDEVEIPLPQDQDAYTLMRPYPCDFCSRRFRKKANLMNHMVCHQIERPHGCNLCGARYRRKCDLINHMKTHAYAPGIFGTSEDEEDVPALTYDDVNNYHQRTKQRKTQPRASRKRKKSNSIYPSSREIEYNNLALYKNNKPQNHLRKKHSSISSVSNYMDDNTDLLGDNPSEFADPASLELQEPVTPRWPVVDESRPHVCQHCGVGFAREKALASHARIHAGDSPFECSNCGEMFWDITLLKAHSKSKHPHLNNFVTDGIYENNEDSYRCNTCSLAFSSQELLKRHQRVHIKRELGDVLDYMCQICGESFPDECALDEHSESHPQLELHRCNLCGESFSDLSSLASHVRRTHPRNNPPNTCSLCGKSCRDRHALQKHMRSHSSERSFSCHQCKKRFHSKARLNRHMSSHRDKAVSCEECGEEFPDGRALINHRHSHNRDSSRQFSCMECGKTFGSRSSQQIHARIHTGERPYGCRFCWKAFADGGTLRKHERIHTGEKPYVCVVCPRAFNQRVVLREHIRSHHSAPDSSSNHVLIYSCKVCSAAFNKSADICAHLVQHSDENTARHRVPTGLGSKRFRRRYRFGNAENNRSVVNIGGSRSLSKISPDSEEKSKKRQSPLKVKNEVNNENLESVVETLETAVESFTPEVNSKSESGRRRVDRRRRRKYKSVILNNRSNNLHVKSRSAFGGFVRRTNTVDSRKRPKTKNVTSSTLAALRAVATKGSGESEDTARVRPRTKNVSFYNTQTQMAKVYPALFPENDQRTSTKPLTRKQTSAMRRSRGQAEAAETEVPIPNNNIVNNTRAQVKKAELLKPVQNDNVFNNDIVSKFPIESVFVKEEPDADFKCEMCSETFTKRSELLIHVPIHI